jgi:carboxymethylenebutenolidase
VAFVPMIEVAAADGTAEAYLAGSQGPGVLLFTDAIGLRHQIEVMADRIAGWGYVVLAPNLFYRSGSAATLAPQADLRLPGEREKFFAIVGERMHEFTPDRARRDVGAYIDALREQSGVADGPIGVAGYCLGARIATYAAGDHPDAVAAVGGFHGGRLVTDAPDSPHLGLAKAKAEFVFGHAENDGSMPADAVEALGEALRLNGLTAANEIYAGAAHGYTMADTSMYNQAGAERADAELRALLERTLARG